MTTRTLFCTAGGILNLDQFIKDNTLLSEMIKLLDYQNSASKFFYKFQVLIKACYVKQDENSQVTRSIFTVLPSEFSNITPSNFKYRERILLSKLKECVNNNYEFQATGSGWILHSVLQIHMKFVETNALSSQKNK